MPPRPPAKSKIPDADVPSLEVLTPFDGNPEFEVHYDCLHANGNVWEVATDAEHTVFSQSLFTGVALQGGSWSNATFSDVRFQDSRFIAPDLSGSHWRDAEIRGGIVSGVQWHGADLRRTAFHQTKIDLANFRNATLTDVVFTDCLLREADFAGATLTRVDFPGCTFERADFSRARLTKVDFRAARLDFARGLDSLDGAIIDTGQLIDLAPALAGHLGIAVSDVADGE